MSSMSSVCGYMFAICAVGGMAVGDVSDAQDKDKGKSETYSLDVICVKETRSGTETPLNNVELKLVYVDRWSKTQRIVATGKSNMQGRFRFKDLDKPKQNAERRPVGYALLGRLNGYATARMAEIAWNRNGDEAKLVFKRPTRFNGLFTDESGNPVSGVTLYDGMYLAKPVPGFAYAKTGRDGKFALKDLPNLDPKSGERFVRRRVIIQCHHPKYGYFNVFSGAKAAPVTIKLKPAYKVKGTLIDSETGKAKPDCIVVASYARGARPVGVPSPMQGSFWVTTKTDKNGNFRLSLCHGTNYNLLTLDDKKAAKAVLVSDPKNKNPVVVKLELLKPVKVKGQLVDSKTGGPLKAEIRVAWHGPDRPRSGSPVNGTLSKPDGSFSLNMIPGKNKPYVSTVDDKFRWKSTEIRLGDTSLEEIDVAEGQEAELEIVVQKTEKK